MESSSRTLVCSVLFLDIVEYSKKPVAEQLELKQAFNRALATALEQVPQRDRIILDTGDGAAVTFMGDPEDALFAALAVRNMASDGMPVRLGVNLGPVRLVKDLNGQMNIIGDGINVAQRVMSFADPGQLLVSRSFYEVVSCLSRDYMNLFRHEGSRTDKHVREHEVYSVVGGAPMARRVAQTESMVQARDGGWLAGMGPLGLRRSALLAAPLAFFLVIGAAVAAKTMLESSAPETKRTAADGKFDKKLVARLEKKPERPSDKPAPSAEPARLELAVLPWGEVLVDGKSRGVSPPLRTLDIPAGSHTIEIRNSTFPSHVEKVNVKAGEAIRIRHRFQK
ncbi:MAG TPA: adenylate/guanylate cyclase domain-containing protein [Burkholderiales bacterium]|nr:adenylate/guanylate cyclase domain-containing protein [Burkholderiales bacterium]